MVLRVITTRSFVTSRAMSGGLGALPKGFVPSPCACVCVSAPMQLRLMVVMMMTSPNPDVAVVPPPTVAGQLAG